MKVCDLISALQRRNQDEEVWFQSAPYLHWHKLGDVETGYNLDDPMNGGKVTLMTEDYGAIAQ